MDFPPTPKGQLPPLHSFAEYFAAVKIYKQLTIQLDSARADGVDRREYRELYRRIEDFEVTHDIKKHDYE